MTENDSEYTKSGNGSFIASEEIQKSYRAAVEDAIANATGSVDGDYYIAADGNLQNVRTGDLSSDGLNLSISVNATKPYPKNGFIKIENSEIVAEQYSDQDPTCTYYEDDRAYKPNKPKPTESGGESNGIHSIRKGAKYVCKVNSTESYTFYVVSNNDTASNGNDNFDLIMANSNLSVSSKWGTSVADGPVTAMNKVIEITQNWTNVPYINFNSDFYSKWNDLKNSGSSVGYKELTINNGTVTIKNNAGNSTTLSGKARARLLTYTEAGYLGCNFNESSCYSWVTQPGNKIFWLLDNASNGRSMFISGYNKVGGPDNMNESYYIAPVISVPKTAMDWAHKVRMS